ncbi:hypothetical protein [Xanthomonas phage DES1]|nr:hypothetical protein [Xanthomonas phage DES1]
MATSNYSLDGILKSAYGTATPASQSQLSQQYGPNTVRPTGSSLVTSSLESILDPSNSYIQNARQRGVEYAAQRGGVNSSIAAGAAERSAIEAAQPLVNQAVNADLQRESQAMTEYLSDRQMTQGFQTELASSAVQSSYNMLNTLQQFALQDPVTYTPEVISGYTNFFNRTTADSIKRLLGTNG